MIDRITIEQWYRKHISHTTVKLLLLIAALILGVQIVILNSISIFVVISVILLVALWKYYYSDYSLFLFIGSMICLSLSSKLTLLIPIFISLYLIYTLLETHRIKRLRYLAKSTPDEIAKIKKTSNKIEIIINNTGGGRKK